MTSSIQSRLIIECNTARKKIPYDEITDYLKLPSQHNPDSKFMVIDAQFSSLNKPGFIENLMIFYLKNQHIYMQKNELPLCNLELSAWIYQQYPDFANESKLNDKWFNYKMGLMNSSLTSITPFD